MDKRKNITRFFFEEIDSTNSWIKRETDTLQGKIPLSVTAETQTEGRGREERSWFSQPGSGLYTSFCIKIKETRHIALLSLAAGTACARLLKGLCKEEIALKWPNDIICSKGKICGILVENLVKGEEIISIAGIGINLNNHPESFKNKSVNKPAVSLKMLTGKKTDPQEIYPLLENLFFESLSVLQKDPSEIIRRARKYSSPLTGKFISFHISNEIKRGIFEGISDSGEAIISRDGQKQKFFSGEMEIER